jgi:uncharacterized protein (TIGR02246 family)
VGLIRAAAVRFAAVNQKDAEALVTEIEAAWNSHDMARFAACFATDADFVNVAGAWWRGRKEIEEEHAARHADRFNNSRMQVRLASFREIGTGIGVMHVTWRLDGHAESGPRMTTDPRRGIWSWTVRRHDGQLEIVSSHNTDVIDALPTSAGAHPGSS